jgi:hypothetical protein
MFRYAGIDFRMAAAIDRYSGRVAAAIRTTGFPLAGPGSRLPPPALRSAVAAAAALLVAMRAVGLELVVYAEVAEGAVDHAQSCAPGQLAEVEQDRKHPLHDVARCHEIVCELRGVGGEAPAGGVQREQDLEVDGPELEVAGFERPRPDARAEQVRQRDPGEV